MSEKEYRCEECGRKFDDEEYKVTNDKDKCIYHCEKNDWNNGIENIKKTKFFFELISSDISKVNDSYLKNSDINKDMKDEYDFEMNKYEYTNVIFPRFGEFFVSFNNTPFDNLNKNIDIFFNRCVFSGDVSFDLIHKAKNINFQSCEFRGKVLFHDIIFNNNFIFEECIIFDSMRFKNIAFNGLVSFIKTNFENELKVSHSRFNESCLLNLTQIKKLSFENSYFRKEANFLDAKISVQNRETARIIKNSFEQQNNFIEANKYYAKEMEEYEKEIERKLKSKEKSFNDYLDFLVFKTHGLSSKHSQNWFSPLLLILIIGIFYSLLSFNSLDSENHKELLEAIKLYTESQWQIYLLWIFISLSVCSFFITMFYPKELSFKYLLLLFVLGSFYIGQTEDILFTFLSYNINPFSIMTSNDVLTIGTLLFKIIIAYLIYQLIISIRQNTRRK